MRLFLTICLMLVFTYCIDNRKHSNRRRIADTWQLEDENEDQVNYPFLLFGHDGTAIFHSRADTIYYFSYSVYGDTLVLVDLHDRIHKHRIKTLTKEQLVFYNLLEHDSEQTYKRRHNDL